MVRKSMPPASEHRTVNRRQIARREKDERMQKIITWSAIGVVALVILVLGYGLFTEVIFKNSAPVAEVDGTKITVDEFQARVRFQRMTVQSQIYRYQQFLQEVGSDPNSESFAQQIQMQIAQLQNQLEPDSMNLMGVEVLNNMIEETLVRQEAARRGLTVSDDEISLAVENWLGYDRNAVITPTTTVTPTAPVTGTATPTVTAATTETAVPTEAPMTWDQYQLVYQNFLSTTLRPMEMPETQFRTIFATDLLKEKLMTAISETMTKTAEQVDIIYFTSMTETNLQPIQERFANNEKPEDILEALTEDTESGVTGEDPSWMAVGFIGTVLGTDIERVAFNTPAGQLSEPVKGQDGKTYLIYVQGHEVRPLEDWALQEKLKQEYESWLNTMNQEPRVHRSDDWADAIPPINETPIQ